MLLRETVANTGVSDNTILNRKIPPRFWIKLYDILKSHVSPEILHKAFHESSAANLSTELSASPACHVLISHFLKKEIGMAMTLPNELTADGNILFSLGTVYGHRLFRLLKFFNLHWGKEEYEPAIRVICQRIWFFYLISWKKLIVSPHAFSVQRSEHEHGVFSFLIQDYLTFTGILWRRAPPLHSDHISTITHLLCGALD